ncbi:MAG: cytochrome, partial [Nevskia sp.]|nr:cytochrome [Nevskia sp.]
MSRRSFIPRIGRLLASVLLIVAFGSSAQVPVADDDAEELAERIGGGNPVAGKLKVESAGCLACHAVDGRGTDADSPKLGGQYADYLVNQLRSFRSGERRHPAVDGEAANIGDADLADIAAYFAGSKKMQGELAADDEPAKNLFVKGDIKRDILPCVSCHSVSGKGKSAGSDIYPVIGGQRGLYLREQLRDFRK